MLAAIRATLAVRRRVRLLNHRAALRRQVSARNRYGALLLMGRRTLHAQRLKVLLDDDIPRLVSIVLALQRLLLLDGQIPTPRILALVCRQGCRWGTRATIPPVPSGMALCPGRAPALAPTRGRIGAPSVKVGWRLAVVTHRNTQDVQWHLAL